MPGRLSPDPEAAVSARYYGAVATEHLDRLARLAAAERERFARLWPRYRDRFLAATLAQGAALHMLTGSAGSGPASTKAAGWTWSSGRSRHDRGPTRWR